MAARKRSLNVGIAIARSPGGSSTNVETLTPREIDVLSAIRRGSTNGEIAGSLGIATSTVKRHVEHILEKLDARNRAQAVARYATSHMAAVAVRSDQAS